MPGGYYVCTFNDFSSAMVLLFDLLIVNNWFVWVDVRTKNPKSKPNPTPLTLNP